MLLLLPILTYDIWFYISHVMLHSRFLYAYHSIHHSSNPTNLQWMDTYVGHWFEGPFQGAGMFFPYFFFQYRWVDTFLVLAFLNVRGMMRHDWRCAWLIGNHHLLHHKHPGYNYGEGWIDSLCGTNLDAS